MSFERLLVECPDFPAKRVRRLAQQVAYLDRLGTPEAKAIKADLMSATLAEARADQRMADLGAKGLDELARRATS